MTPDEFVDRANAIRNRFMSTASTDLAEAAFKSEMVTLVNDLYASGGQLADRLGDPILDRDDVEVIVSRGPHTLFASAVRRSPDRLMRQLDAQREKQPPEAEAIDMPAKPQEETGEYIVTARVRVRDFSAADAAIGVRDRLNDVSVIGDPEVVAMDARGPKATISRLALKRAIGRIIYELNTIREEGFDPDGNPTWYALDRLEQIRCTAQLAIDGNELACVGGAPGADFGGPIETFDGPERISTEDF